MGIPGWSSSFTGFVIASLAIAKVWRITKMDKGLESAWQPLRVDRCTKMVGKLVWLLDGHSHE